MGKALLVRLLVLTGVAIAIDQAAASGLNPNSSHPCEMKDSLMNPTQEVRHGQGVVWQIPPNPKSVLFLAHGVNRDPYVFFDPAPACEQCKGMPEDRTIVLEALRRGYAVISVKSIGDAYESWPLEDSEDLVIVTRVIKEWTREHSLESLPLSAFGNSAGGFFVVSLSLMLPIRALVLMSSQGNDDFEQFPPSFLLPPMFFAYMPSLTDSLESGVTTRADVERAMATLIRRGVSVAEKQCWPFPIYPFYFTERIRCMTDEISKKVYGAYKAEGWLDSNGYLKKDPHWEDCQSTLRKWDAVPFCNELGVNCFGTEIEQELGVAYAIHGLTSAANEEIFSWLDSTLLLSSDMLSATVLFDTDGSK